MPEKSVAADDNTFLQIGVPLPQSLLHQAPSVAPYPCYLLHQGFSIVPDAGCVLPWSRINSFYFLYLAVRSFHWGQ